MTLRSILALSLISLSLAAQGGYFTDRAEVRNFIEEVSQRQHLDPHTLSSALDAAEPLPKVIELVKPPANPGVRSWQRYRARFIDRTRTAGGLKFWQENEQLLREAESLTGVPAEIIVSLIGVETVYGRNKGNFNTLSALATLAFDYPPRAELFRHELEALFLLAQEQGRDVHSYKGSYAGALGLPQFLPSSVRNFALDGDRDGDINLSESRADAIFSVANFLARHGWQRGGQIVLPARISDAEQARNLVAVGILPALDPVMLKAGGIHSSLPDDSQELVTLVDLVSPDADTEYWLGFQNFYVITRYNRSSFYAMVVHDLAQELKSARAQQGHQKNTEGATKKTRIKPKQAQKKRS